MALFGVLMATDTAPKNTQAQEDLQVFIGFRGYPGVPEGARDPPGQGVGTGSGTPALCQHLLPLDVKENGQALELGAKEELGALTQPPPEKLVQPGTEQLQVTLGGQAGESGTQGNTRVTPRARRSPAAWPAAAQCPPRCWRGGGGCNSGNKPEGRADTRGSPKGMWGTCGVLHSTHFPARGAPTSQSGSAGSSRPPESMRLRRASGRASTRNRHSTCSCGDSECQGTLGWVKKPQDGPTWVHPPLRAPRGVAPRLVAPPAAGPWREGSGAGEAPWREGGKSVREGSSCPQCACPHLCAHHRHPLVPSGHLRRCQQPDPARFVPVQPAGIKELRGRRIAARPALAQRLVACGWQGTPLLALPYLSLPVRCGSSRVSATRLWWWRESWHRSRQSAGSWGESGTLRQQPWGGVTGWAGDEGTPFVPPYLLMPVVDALEQVVQEDLHLGQRLAAQRPVQAQEGQEGDEGQAGAVRVVTRLGDHAQRQELREEGDV